jgi:hypothetical protein
LKGSNFNQLWHVSMWSSTCVEAQMTHSRCSNALNYFHSCMTSWGSSSGGCHLLCCLPLLFPSPIVSFSFVSDLFYLLLTYVSLLFNVTPLLHLPTHHNWTSFLSISIICFHMLRTTPTPCLSIGHIVL